MSDREIMDAKFGQFRRDKSIVNPDLYSKINKKEIKYTTKIEYPDAKKHQIVSFAKSGIRILGYGLLIVNVPIAVGVLIFSEVIGIIEELV
jgi:hypothetical protein